LNEGGGGIRLKIRHGQRTFVGLGFGPIQGGLFLYEAFRSGNFGRLVVAEVVTDTVDAVRSSGGYYAVNIAHPDRIEAARIGPIEIALPGSESDRELIVQAISQAGEIATAVPSVQHYVSEGPGSIHRMLARGLRRKAESGGPPAVIYAAENHNHAAEILEESVQKEIPAGEHQMVHAKVRFLNTVIGKMSGLISDPAEICERGLERVTEQLPRAFLVEAFNRILISRINFGETIPVRSFPRGITTFEEKEDLLPFEEAKLYGHNATHALAAYVGAYRGIQRVADLRRFPDMIEFIRDAFIEESGEALIRRHAGVDPLFTPEGYRHYADDLLDRMLNPYLQDTMERVGRDPERKLGWDDRLAGTIRIARAHGISARRFAAGAAAALALLDPATVEDDSRAACLLGSLWSEARPDRTEMMVVMGMIDQGRSLLSHWKRSGFPPLAGMIEGMRLA
jgi:mannitol-1-phosphate 5-dehydrogenase